MHGRRGSHLGRRSDRHYGNFRDTGVPGIAAAEADRRRDELYEPAASHCFELGVAQLFASDAEPLGREHDVMTADLLLEYPDVCVIGEPDAVDRLERRLRPLAQCGARRGVAEHLREDLLLALHALVDVHLLDRGHDAVSVWGGG